MTRTSRSLRGLRSVDVERGAAVPDFVLVSILVTLLFAALLQVGFALHVRNTLLWCASEGARYGARSGNAPSDGAGRARGLIADALSAAYADGVSARRTSHDGVAVVEVRIVAPLPVVAMVGPAGALTVEGRAFAEDQ